MTTLVERLRRKAEYGIGSGEFYNDILVEAADRIEALEAALLEIANISEGSTTANSIFVPRTASIGILPRIAKIARAALSPSGNGEGTT